MRKSTERGQSMVEAALVLLVFFTLLLGVIDCGQVLFAHESLVERVRFAVRWGVVHPWNQETSEGEIRNLVLYNQIEAPSENAPAYLGLRPVNVVVRHRVATPQHPDDETLGVTIVDFQPQFFSPLFGDQIAGALVSHRAVSISSPMAARQAFNAAETIYPQP